MGRGVKVRTRLGMQKTKSGRGGGGKGIENNLFTMAEKNRKIGGTAKGRVKVFGTRRWKRVGVGKQEKAVDCGGDALFGRRGEGGGATLGNIGNVKKDCTQQRGAGKEKGGRRAKIKN